MDLQLRIPRMTAAAPEPVLGAVGPRTGRGASGIRRVSPVWILVEAGLAATDETTQKWLDPDLGHPHRKVGFAASLTRLGDPSIFLIPAIGLYFSGPKGRQASLETATAVADASIVTFALKELVGKDRPEQSRGKVRFHGPGTGHESFPSGHSTAAWAGATVLGARYPKLKLLFYTVAAGVSWSRVRLSKHFLSDVAAGAAIGVASGTRVVHRGHGFFDFRF